jgi:hypothetical protein
LGECFIRCDPTIPRPRAVSPGRESAIPEWETIRDCATGKRVGLFSGIERSARLKLDRREAATSKKDLAALPGNRLKH